MVGDYQRDARVFKALCDPKRLAILEQLRDGEKCACMLLEPMDLTQSGLSYHMKVLCDSVIHMRNASKEIATVMKTIDDITFETNILALNAAIEAALNPDQQFIDEGYFFFVTGHPDTDVAGQYFYAKTADEHQANVETAGWAY